MTAEEADRERRRMYSFGYSAVAGLSGQMVRYVCDAALLLERDDQADDVAVAHMELICHERFRRLSTRYRKWVDQHVMARARKLMIERDEIRKRDSLSRVM